MSKSLGNYVGINEPPNDMFGKLMSISDDLMWRYFDLVSFRSLTEIGKLKAETEGGRNPKEVKIELACEIVSRFHGEASAQAASQAFNQRFAQGQLPDDIAEVSLSVGADGLALANVLKAAGLTSSTSESHRMVKQGAVRIDGAKIEDAKQIVVAGPSLVIQVGKRRIARIIPCN